MHDRPWIIIDPVNNEYGLACSHCAMGLVASGGGTMPEMRGDVQNPPAMVILAPGNTLESSGVLH